LLKGRLTNEILHSELELFHQSLITGAFEASDLTRAAGLTHGLVSRLEDGTGNLSLKTLAAIAKAFNVTISELVDGV
jgi:transcriptional regulator with XRE-family HTH domain